MNVLITVSTEYYFINISVEVQNIKNDFDELQCYCTTYLQNVLMCVRVNHNKKHILGQINFFKNIICKLIK